MTTFFYCTQDICRARRNCTYCMHLHPIARLSPLRRLIRSRCSGTIASPGHQSSSHRVVTSTAAFRNSFQHGKNLLLLTASITTFNAATARPVSLPLSPRALDPFASTLVPTPAVFAAVKVRFRDASSAFLVSFLRKGCGNKALVSSTIRGVVG